jgi:hypothetical protein
MQKGENQPAQNQPAQNPTRSFIKKQGCNDSK